jgi:hypothetical protein
LSIFIIVIPDCWIFIIAREISIQYNTIIVSLALEKMAGGSSSWSR